MDDELHELEAELRRLRPVAPSRALAAGIGRSLSAPRPNYWAWVALPLAAALVGVVLLRQNPAASTPATVTAVTSPPKAKATAPMAYYKPVSAENLLYDHRDEGLVTLADGTTARRYRSSYVDTITWKNSRTQASLRWSVPRTEERVVPVSFQ